MKGKSIEEIIAEDICELNCWRTPPRFKSYFKRNLSEEEIKIAMKTLEIFVPYKQWLKTWQKQPRGSR